MNSTDPDISFDKHGRCNHCREATFAFENGGIGTLQYTSGREGTEAWKSIVYQIRKTHDYSNSPYDCLLGISGGVDSCYVAYMAKTSGLNPLLLHIDTGWNSELATSNIYNICSTLQLSLQTVVLNWKAIQQMQLAYLRSNLSNLDVIQDHAIFSSIRRFARNYRFKYLISGGNLASEIIFPKAWHGPAMDGISLKAIVTRYGAGNYLADYPLMGPIEYYIKIGMLGDVKTLRPLNLAGYNKTEAEKLLSRECKFQPYPMKHGENVFTRLFQNYILLNKYGYDKRRPHLSSLISSGCITRKDAMKILNEEMYNKITLRNDIEYFIDKLGISRDEFLTLSSPDTKAYYQDFPNWHFYYSCISTLKKGISLFNRSLLTNRL